MKDFLTPIDEMLDILSKESEQNLPEGLTEKDKRWIINSLMAICSPGYVNERFLVLQDDLLKRENEMCRVDCSKFKFKKHFALTRHDIVDLDVDAICCETVDYLGNMTPNLKCIDNRLLIRGGLSVREECNKLNAENGFVARVGSAFSVPSCNLVCGEIVKMILPRVDNIMKYDVDRIKSAIVSGLNILKEHEVRRFAINLTVDNFFNIPQEMYARIVVNEIADFIRENRYKMDCVLVVNSSEIEELVMHMLKIKLVQ